VVELTHLAVISGHWQDSIFVVSPRICCCSVGSDMHSSRKIVRSTWSEVTSCQVRMRGGSLMLSGAAGVVYGVESADAMACRIVGDAETPQLILVGNR
jgi:hypothetical protein